jgi:hypothetical protein
MERTIKNWKDKCSNCQEMADYKMVQKLKHDMGNWDNYADVSTYTIVNCKYCGNKSGSKH